MIETPLGSFTGEELMLSGHNACPGCGAALVVRYLVKEVGQKALIVIPASCWSIISGVVPLRCLETTVLHCPFPAAAAVGSGLKKGLHALGDQETQIIVLAGDGGTFDIGLQGLSGAAERNENIIFICYDNEAYMNTGMQKSSATPFGSLSTTTPAPRVKANPKKDILKIITSHRIPYAATATIAFPGDMSSKFRRAMEVEGFRFLHILTPCPQGWGSPVDKTVELSRSAVLSGIFPLLEVEDGRRYTLNYVPEHFIPVQEYFKPQKRFAFLKEEELRIVEREIAYNWEELLLQTGKKGASPES